LLGNYMVFRVNELQRKEFFYANTTWWKKKYKQIQTNAAPGPIKQLKNTEFRTHIDVRTFADDFRGTRAVRIKKQFHPLTRRRIFRYRQKYSGQRHALEILQHKWIIYNILVQHLYVYRFRGDVLAFLYRDVNTFDTLYLISVCLISIGVVSIFDELRPDEIATIMLFERIRFISI